LAIAGWAIAAHDREPALGVVSLATEPLLAVPVGRAGRRRERVEDRARPLLGVGADLAHAQHEPVRAHVAGAQLVGMAPVLEDRDVGKRERGDSFWRYRWRQ